MMYEMSMRFKLDISPLYIKKQMEELGAPYPIARDALVVRLKQTVSFIPDNNMIQKYAQVILKEYQEKAPELQFDTEAIRFDGYDYVNPTGGSENEKF